MIRMTGWITEDRIQGRERSKVGDRVVSNEPHAEVFCVIDGRDYTMNELVDYICGALGMNWRPWHVPVKIAELAGKIGGLVEKGVGIELPIDSDRVRKLSRPLTFSCEKAKRVLGYEAVETIEEGS